MSILGVGVDAITVSTLHLKHGDANKQLMKNIPLCQIVIGKYQPRKTGVITKESIQDLVASIKELGVLQPIIVRQLGMEQYELIAGERRYRSAHEADLKEIPCMIKDVGEKDAFAIALIENIQREQLSLLEEAESLLKLKDEHLLSVDEVSKIIGKPRTTIANLIRVASLLSPEGKLLWENDDVDYGHIRAVIMLSHEHQNSLLQYVVNNTLSVRETEGLVKENKYYKLDQMHPEKFVRNRIILDDELKYIAEKFSSIYDAKVSVNAVSSGRIKVSIKFENVEKIIDYLKDLPA